ncbi:M48 family metallopeptidase [Streptomyces sp. NPDC059096]|uniref:M48 family metallopeptidase n=1 Tax=Streptomyces sp. NPDC059096 TaxID=3346727 RepID=UPI0036A1C894
MGAPAPRSQIDERAMGAGTTMRFALLIVLLLAASGAIMLPVVGSLHSGDRVGCQLALGIDPDRSGDMASAVNALAQAVPYHACMAKYAPPPALWQIYGWPVVLSVAAGLLFALLPAWKAWRRGAVTLDSVDPDGEIHVRLSELARTAGLDRLPRMVVDRSALSAGAMVFGRNGRPVVCLYNGLLAVRDSDPERFRAVVLHEFAHIANRDVTVTYGTIALWRAFLALVLAPYLVWLSTWVHDVLKGWTWSTDAPVVARGLLLPMVIVALVHLARSDVLRSREVYADLAAVRWGADPRGWDTTTRAPEGGGWRRALGSLREHWGTHPRGEERRHALTDPAPLFGVRAAPVFLTGAAASMVNFHLLTYLSTYNMYSLWRVQLVSLAPAVLVAGVIGTALWRTVAYAVLTGDPVPSGIRTGLWLGAGLGAGGLFTGYGTGSSEWVVQRPAVLVLVLGAGVAFTWWITRCAHLWATVWRGRSLRPPLLLGLACATLALSAWFAWWTMDGASWAAGASYDSGALRPTILQMVTGSGAAGQPVGEAASSAMVSVVAVLRPVLNGFIASPLIPAAVAVLWLMPLAAWAIGGAPGTPRWVAGALPGGSPAAVPTTAPVPALRRALAPGLLGGAVCWLGLVGVQAYLHTSQSGRGRSGGVYEVRYLVWMFVVLVGAAAVAAVVAGTRIDRELRLAGTLIAAETAALLGLAGMALLVVSDGCVAPLNTLKNSCSWEPVWQSLRWSLVYLINGTLTLAAISAFLVAAAGSLGARARSRWGRPTRTGDGRRARPDGRAVGARRSAVRLGAVAVCVSAAVAIAVAVPVSLARYHTMVANPATQQSVARQGTNIPAVPVSASTRARQVHAWHRLGGRYLLEHAAADFNHIKAVVRSASDTGNTGLAYLARLRPTCADFGRIAGWVNGAYFRVPDPVAQAAWRALGAQAQRGSLNCERALNEKDDDLFVTSLRELVDAGRSAEAVTKRVNTLLSEAGYRAYRNTPGT